MVILLNIFDLAFTILFTLQMSFVFYNCFVILYATHFLTFLLLNERDLSKAEENILKFHHLNLISFSALFHLSHTRKNPLQNQKSGTVFLFFRQVYYILYCHHFMVMLEINLLGIHADV